MIKNLYIFTSKSPEFWGGVEKVSKELWYWFIKTWKYNVSFVFPWEETKTENKDWINFVTIKNELTIPFFWEIFLNLKLVNFFKNLSKEDIVINNGFSPYFYLLFFKKQFKLVHICHWTLHWSAESVKNRWLNVFKRLLNTFYANILDTFVKFIIRKSDIIVTLSKFLKQELIQYYKADKDKVKIIFNWCDLNNELSLHKNSKIKVLFIWNNPMRKWLNILEWVAKWLINENISFDVIWTNNYESTISNIKSLWRLDRKNLYNKMKESDFVFLPSWYEWQPLVLLEAMSFWCIPVYSKFCHMDMLEGTQLEKFCSDENLINDYIKIFQNMLSNKDRIEELRRLSKNIVSEYAWNSQISYYIDLIDKL